MNTQKLLGLTFAVSMLLSVLPAQERVDRTTDVLTLRFLLSNDLFRHVQGRMEEYQAAYRRDAAAEDNIHRAVRAFRVNDERMGSQLDRWVAASSRSALAHVSRGAYRFYLGRAFVRAGRQEDAAPYLQQASKDIARAAELDGQLLESKLVTIEMLTSFGDVESAKKVLDEVLAAAPGSFHARRVFLWGLSPHTRPGSEGAMQQVIAQAGQFAAINPRLRLLEGYPDLFRGIALQSDGKHQQAIAAFTRALESGEFFEFSLFRAMSHEAAGELQAALADYDTVLSEYRQSIDAVRGKARVLRTMGRTAEADRYDVYAEELLSFVAPVRGGIREIQTVVPPDLTSNAAQDSLPPADVPSAIDTTAQPPAGSPAIDDLTERLESDPTNAGLWFERGMAYLILRDYGHAERDLLKVIELDPDDVRGHYNLGWIYLHHGMYEKGIERNTAAIRLRANFGEAYMNRAFGLRMLGKIDEAGPDLRKACDLGVPEACALLRQPPVPAAEQSEGADK